jgi:hypothetical protein
VWLRLFLGTLASLLEWMSSTRVTYVLYLIDTNMKYHIIWHGERSRRQWSGGLGCISIPSTHLPHHLEFLQSWNPGTIIDIDDYQDANGDRVLQRSRINP